MANMVQELVNKERNSDSDISTSEASFEFQTPNMTLEDWAGVLEKSCAHTLELKEPIRNIIQETLYQTKRYNFAAEKNFVSEISHSEKKSLLERETPRVSKIGASLLEIGSWQITSKCEEHVVAKCHFATRRLAWEILEDGVKMKIEIQWEQISSLKVVLENYQPGILEVELKEPPLFFMEKEPDPRKHSCWVNISDFTQDQAATNCRRHYLLFPPGAFDTHFEKLTQFEPRFRQMCQSSSPCHPNPHHFPSDHHTGRNKSLNCNGNGSEMNSPQESPHSKDFNKMGAIVPFDNYGTWRQGNSVQQSLCSSDAMSLSVIEEDYQQNHVDKTICTQPYLPISRISPTSDHHMGGNISFNGNGNDPELSTLQQSPYRKEFNSISTAIFPYGNNGYDPQINSGPQMNSFQLEPCSSEPMSFTHIGGDHQQNHVDQTMFTQPTYDTTSVMDHSWTLDELISNFSRGISSSMGVWDQQQNNDACMIQGDRMTQVQFLPELPKISEESPIVPDQVKILQSNYDEQGLNDLQSRMPMCYESPLPGDWNAADLNAGVPPLGYEHQRDADENNGGQFYAEPISYIVPEDNSINANFGPYQTTENIIGN